MPKTYLHISSDLYCFPLPQDAAIHGHYQLSEYLALRFVFLASITSGLEEVSLSVKSAMSDGLA